MGTPEKAAVWTGKWLKLGETALWAYSSRFSGGQKGCPLIANLGQHSTCAELHKAENQCVGPHQRWRLVPGVDVESEMFDMTDNTGAINSTLAIRITSRGVLNMWAASCAVHIFEVVDCSSGLD